MSLKQVVGFTCVFDSEVDQSIRKLTGSYFRRYFHEQPFGRLAKRRPKTKKTSDSPDREPSSKREADDRAQAPASAAPRRGRTARDRKVKS